jgi:ribonuclease T2
MRAMLLWLVMALPLCAEGERAGDFDYFVLSLSWSPNWCAIEGDARRSPQCDAAHDHGWILHGLWPQFERGFPSYCKTAERAPSRSMTAAMEDIMGTSGLAWHQWKKHGTCTALTAERYYTLSRDAYAQIKRPEVFRKLDKAVRLPASVVEEAFLKDNPSLAPDMITVTCKDGHIQEARICLDKDDLSPRRCGADVLPDCTAIGALFTPIR